MMDSALLVPYLPRRVVESPARRGWAETGTLVFADISGFTKLSEKLAGLGKAGAEELVRIINRTFESLLGVAGAEGGDLLKFGGDALLLLFTGDDHAVRACRAAAGMRAALKAQGPVRTGKGQVVLRISMGAHSGTFQLLLAGVGQRELLVVGEDASTVTAMETEAEAGEILVSPATAALLPEVCRGEPKGPGILLRRSPPGDPPGSPPPVVPGGDLSDLVPAAVRRRAEHGVHDSEHRHMAVAFVHMGGVDAFLRDAGLDALGLRFDALVSAAARAAESTGTCLIATDIAGDGAKLILTAGAPEGVEDAEGRLLEATRTIMDTGFDLPVRIGLNSGHGFACEVGAPWRVTSTVMGDVVNLAARLMGKARPGEIVASKALVERSEVIFEKEALDPFMVKGKSEPQHAFLIRRRLGRGRVAAFDTEFLGREAELGLLRDALAKARQGAGVSVELVGAPGVGKTRLIDELVASGDVRTIRVVGEQFQADRGYFAARLLLRAALRIDQNADAATAGALLIRRVTDLAPERLPYLPLLAVAVDADVPSAPEADATDPVYRAGVIQDFADRLLQLTLTEPTVLVLEDSMWFDEASSGLIGRALTSVRSRPWLVILSHRGQGQGLHAEASSTTRLELAPLPDDVVGEIAISATEDLPLSEHELEVLRERAAGNPLFLLELLGARRDGGSLDDLPTSLEDIIASRIDRMTPRDARVLRYAAVLGDRFTPELFDSALADLVEQSSTTAFDDLEEFIVRDGPMFRFTHGMVRHVGYEGLPYARRRELHARVAEALARRPGRPDDTRLGLLSLHFDRAHLHELAWKWSRRAGERARGKFANAEAAAFFERAVHNGRLAEGVERHDVAEVAEALGDAAEVAGHLEQAAHGFRLARALRVPDDPVMPELLRKEAQLRERMGRYPSSLQWYRRGMAAAQRLPEPAASERLGAMAAGRAAVHMRQNKYKQCAQWCRKAIALAERTGDKHTLAQAYSLLESALTDLGDPGAVELRGIAVRLFEEVGDLVGLGNAYVNLAIDEAIEGRWDQAAVYFERSRDARVRAGHVVGVASVSHNLGEMRSDQGRLEEAEQLQRTARRIWRASGYLMGVGAVTSGLGRTLARLGRTDDGLDLLRTAAADLDGLGIPDWAEEARLRLVEALVFGGRWDDAASELDALRATVSKGMQPMLLRLDGVVRAAVEGPSAAEPLLREGVQEASEARAVYEELLTLAELARLPSVPAVVRTAAADTAVRHASDLGVDLPRVIPKVPWA